MKKTLLTICLTAFTAMLSQAQTIEIALEGTTTDISGTTHTETVSTTDTEHVNFLVKNAGSSSQNLIITRVNLHEPAGWSNYLCWGHSTDPFGGICYSVESDSAWTTPDEATIGAGEFGKLQAYISPSTSTATPGLYRYFVGTTSNPRIDSVDIQLNSVLAVNEIKKDLVLSVSPNPANEKVTIKVSNLDNGTMKIVDVLGNVVMNDNFSGSKTLNVAEYRNGVYFILISGENINTINRKLVVRH